MKITISAEENHDSETGKVSSSYLIDEHATEGHAVDRQAVLFWLGRLLETYASDDTADSVPGTGPKRRRMMNELPCDLVELVRGSATRDPDDGLTLRFDTGGCSCCQA